jgi:hypothetical protein
MLKAQVKARVANRGRPPTITVIVAEAPWAPVSVNAHRPSVNRVNLLTCVCLQRADVPGTNLEIIFVLVATVFALWVAWR